jgi:DNA-binding MarR family transcriptional regulator
MAPVAVALGRFHLTVFEGTLAFPPSRRSVMLAAGAERRRSTAKWGHFPFSFRCLRQNVAGRDLHPDDVYGYIPAMTTPCYCAALRIATRKTTAIYDEALAPAGVGLAQFSLLRKIERGGKLSLSELGRLVSLDRSTVGRNVKVLRRMGLIEIGPGDDHREATVTLAEGGRAILRNGAPLWDAAQRRIETALGEGGAEMLRTLLAAL